MDEEITIIDANTRNQRIMDFFINNKKNIIITFLVILIIIVGYFSFLGIKERNNIKLSNQFNLITINFNEITKKKLTKELIDIVNRNDTTYSPLALYFLLDNNLIINNADANNLFDELINETNLKNEIRNLIIYKKALFNSNFASENDLLKILNPITNSESIWKSHALYLLAEFFYSKDEYQKAKQFYNLIITLPNSSGNIKLESQKRLDRDFSE